MHWNAGVWGWLWIPQAPMPPQETGELKMRVASSLEQVEQVRSRSRWVRGCGGHTLMPTFWGWVKTSWIIWPILGTNIHGTTFWGERGNSTVERGMMPVSLQEASFVVCHMSGFSHVSCSKSQSHDGSMYAKWGNMDPINIPQSC